MSTLSKEQVKEIIRRIIYTTNIIEGLHRQYRKVTKTKTMFPSDNSLEKMLYLASMNVVKKWTQLLLHKYFNSLKNLRTCTVL